MNSPKRHCEFSPAGWRSSAWDCPVWAPMVGEGCLGVLTVLFALQGVYYWRAGRRYLRS